MTGVQCALWGLFGWFAVEGLEFAAAIRNTGKWPWHDKREPTPSMFLLSVAIRMAVSAGLTAGIGLSGQISGPFAAIVIGIAAPLIVERSAQMGLAMIAGPDEPSGPQEPALGGGGSADAS